MSPDPNPPAVRPIEHPHQTSNSPDHSVPDAPPHRSKLVRVLVWAVILLVFAVAFWLVWTHKSAEQPGTPHRGAGGAPSTITTAPVTQGDLGIYLDAIGTVTPVYTASITSQVNGIILAVHFKEGQVVHKGEPLIDIDPRPYLATLLQAQGLLERDQNLLAQAQQDLERYRAAWARNAIPRQQLDDQEKIAAQYQGTVKNDQGLVDYDQVQVDYCHIKAPIDGRIGLRLVDPGNVVTANGNVTLAVITQMQPITVVFTIPEDSLSQVNTRLRTGARLPVDAYDRTGEHEIDKGLLLTLDNQVDTTTGTVKGRASYANSKLNLFPNQFVNTRLLVDTLHNATLVPNSAIQHNGPVAFVYVVSGGEAHERKVEVLATDGVDSAITSAQSSDNSPATAAVQPGEILANSSFDKLQDGAKVIVSNQPNATHSGQSQGTSPLATSAEPNAVARPQPQPATGQQTATPSSPGDASSPAANPAARHRAGSSASATRSPSR